MQCKNCAADYPSDQLRCPYCGTVNEHALELAKELQQYDKEYVKAREEMLETGENTVLKKLTKGISIAFLAVLLVFALITAVYRYNYAPNAKSNVVGKKYEKNKEMLKQYMDNKEYIRAYLLASSTDPTTEYFNNYPEYKDELSAIYSYSLIFSEIRTIMDDMDEGDNYNSLTPTQVISLSIFYGIPESEVKSELEDELNQYLRNLYRLTDDEIEELKTVVTSTDFSLDGDYDYEAVSKERMVNYFGK